MHTSEKPYYYMLLISLMIEKSGSILHIAGHSEDSIPSANINTPKSMTACMAAAAF